MAPIDMHYKSNLLYFGIKKSEFLIISVLFGIEFYKDWSFHY